MGGSPIHFHDSANATPAERRYKEVTSSVPLPVRLYDAAGGVLLPPAAVMADGEANTAVSRMATRGQLFNGTTFDIQRANTEATLLPSAARTALAVPGNITNHNARGIMLVLNVTAKAAATTLQITLDMIDPISGANGFFANSAAFAAAAGSNYVFVVYPGVLAADFAIGGATGAITARSAILPRTFRVLVYPGDASSVTYSLGYSLIL